MNNGKIVVDRYAADEELPKREKARSAKGRIAQVIQRLEACRRLKESPDFRKFKKLIIDEVFEVSLREVRNKKNSVDQIRYFQGNLDALEKYDLDIMIGFYERELFKAKLTSKNDENQPNNPEGQG